MKRSGLIALILGSYLSQANALQLVPIADNGMASVKISQHNLNHIAVLDDRIKRVKGLDGQYEFQEDADTGHLFLKSNQRKDVTLFITTEKGKTYQLQLKPSNISAETIVLQPTDAMGGSLLGQTNLASEDEVIHLMEALARSTLLNGYSKTDLRIKTDSHEKGLALTRIANIEGHNLIGEVYLIQNNRPSPYAFIANTWLINDCRAVAMSQAVVAPHQTAILYRVRDHG